MSPIRSISPRLISGTWRRVGLAAGLVAAATFMTCALSAGPAQRLTGVGMLPQKPLDDAFGDATQMLDGHPEIAAALRKAYGDGVLLPETYCAVHLDDGRDFFLISATTPGSEGRTPHGVAYDWMHKVAYVGRAWSERAKEAFFGNPDARLRSVLTVVALGCPNLRQTLGLDPYGRDTPPPAATPAAAPAPGGTSAALAWPSATDCRQARATTQKTAQTQYDFNTAAGAHATLEACDEHVAYDALARSVAGNPAARAKLELSQQKWEAFVSAHEVARFPHQGEQGYYGSMLPMCQAEDDAAVEHARTLELRGEGHCTDGASTAARAREKDSAHAAMMAMVDVFKKVKAQYAADPKFLDALDGAEKAWFAYQTAQVDFVAESTGGPDSACAQRELARVVRERNDQVGEWSKKRQEGDGCLGSYGGAQ